LAAIPQLEAREARAADVTTSSRLLRIYGTSTSEE